jgi:hypothetical protein
VRHRPGERLSRPADAPPAWHAWAALALAVAATWSTLSVGPRVGRALLATAPGAWALGAGLVVAGACAVAVLLARAVRHGADAAHAALLVATASGWAWALGRLPAKPIERVHLLEYGVLGWLAWRAVRQHVTPRVAFGLAALLTAALGWGEELVQWVTPGRYYDLRDVAMNALGGVLGLGVVALLQPRPPRDAAAG